VLSGCASSHYVEQQAGGLLFFLQMPDASRVQFSSSADNYILHDTEQNRTGEWRISVPNTDELKYFYVVDGAVYLPECQLRETDDFGSENCLYQSGNVTFSSINSY
jgi:Pyruvate/2-oxoacid:ferredoxin oxidoreductase delta subunit